MSKVESTKKEVKEEKLSAFESAFGKLAVTDKEGAEVDVGILVPREDTGTLFNPSAPQLSHLFNGPSHLLPSPAKIYSSFMEGLLKKAHTHVAGADAAQPEEADDSAMQLDAPAGTVETKSSKLAEVNGMDSSSSASENQPVRQTKAMEKTFYDSMFKFFSSYAPRDSKATVEEPEMPASLLNELTASVKQPKQSDAKRQGKGKKQRERSSSGSKKAVEQEPNSETDEPTPATPAEPIPEAVATTATTPAESPRKKKRASQPTAEGAEADVMVVENDASNSEPREEPQKKEKEANGTAKTTTPRRRRKSSQQE